MMTNCVFCNIDRGDTQNPSCACGNYRIAIGGTFYFPEYSEEEKLKISIFLKQLTVNNFNIRINGLRGSTPDIFIEWFTKDEKQLLAGEKKIDDIIR